MYVMATAIYDGAHVCCSSILHCTEPVLSLYTSSSMCTQTGDVPVPFVLRSTLTLPLPPCHGYHCYQHIMHTHDHHRCALQRQPRTTNHHTHAAVAAVAAAVAAIACAQSMELNTRLVGHATVHMLEEKADTEALNRYRKNRDSVHSLPLPCNTRRPSVGLAPTAS